MSDHKDLVKRYLIFFLGSLLNSFGMAVVTKGMLGTSPIVSVPYSLSLIIPRASLGNWTIAFSLLFLHELQGVREGTIIAAAITGDIVKVITKKCRPLTRRLLP